MKTKASLTANLPAKLLASLVVVVCLAIGLVGLILPIIPGLLFLVIAAVLVGRHFPSAGSWLRRSRSIGRHLDNVDSFVDLPLAGKLQFGAWFCAKVLLDSVLLVGALVTKLSKLAGRRYY